MLIINEFLNEKAALESFSLYQENLTRYYCTPNECKIFGRLGSGGIHFCVYSQKLDDNVPIIAVSPEAICKVAPIACNTKEFIRLVLTSKDIGAIECAMHGNKNIYNQYIKTLNHFYYSYPDDLLQATLNKKSLEEKFRIYGDLDVFTTVCNAMRQLKDIAFTFS